MKLSILICTVTTRVNNFLPEIISHLSYLSEALPVQILYLGDNKTMTVGEKRNKLIKLAKGEYISFVDDDDKITDDYVDELLKAMQQSPFQSPSVICFQAYRHQDGKKDRRVFYDMSFTKDTDQATRYERLPNHLMCWRRDLAIQIPFDEINYGEDASWAIRMKPLIQSQVLINKTLYHYFFNSSLTETQKL